MFGAVDRGFEQLFARLAILERNLRRLLRGVLQRNDEFSVELAILAGLFGGGEIGFAEAIERILAVDDERAVLGRGEQLVRERGAERGFFLVEFFQLVLIGGV